MRRKAKAFVRIIDASRHTAPRPALRLCRADARLRGLKLHLVFDPRAELPARFAITSPKVSDITVGRVIAIEAGAIYVFDKCYLDYAWWQDIVAAKAFFVTRLKNNVHRREVCERTSRGEAILADRSLKIGHKKPRGGADNPLYGTRLREIVVERPGEEPLDLVTNDGRGPLKQWKLSHDGRRDASCLWEQHTKAKEAMLEPDQHTGGALVG